MKQILLIEDNTEICENTAEILELANYKVTTAQNGKEGVKLALETKPDLILCDIMMPVLDGYGVLYSLHDNIELRNTPFIFLTAKSDRNDLRRAMELGADDYITKPFNDTELLAAIERRFKKIEGLKEDAIGRNRNCVSGSGVNNEQLLTQYLLEQDTNSYKKKQLIYIEGNRPSRLLYLKKGKVKTYKTNEDGKELVVGLYNTGDFFGYVSLLTASQYHETAEAMEDCEVALIPKPDFEDLLKDCFISKKFIALLAKDLIEKEEQLLAIAYSSLRKKVANALITLKKKYQADAENFSIDLSRDNLATIAGTALESMVRTLSDFKAEKLIDIHNDRHITILNEKMLVHMLN